MYLKQIELKNFRNYQSEKVVFHPKTNIIMGMNAQGKTNLLESLYIMGLGRSFRTNKDSDMIYFGKKICFARCHYIKAGEKNCIEITITRSAKNVKINGVSVEKNSDLLENIYIVAFSPEDLKIIKDEPEKRRRFIDRELSQLKPVYYKNLVKYRKALLQRNTLLKQENVNKAMIDVWDRVLAEYGSKIIEDRKEFVERLNTISQEIHFRITNGKEKLKIHYETIIPMRETLEKTEELFIEKLQENQDRDLFRGNTGFGPHKDDIKIYINDIDARYFGSQGQQRTAALSLKLAEIKLIKEEKREDAILLLDDVLSELDEERQKFLLDTLDGVQLFITAADPDESFLSYMKEGKTFFVKEGSLQKKV